MAVALVGSFDFFQVLNCGSSPARLRLGKGDCGVRAILATQKLLIDQTRL
jgi:hypothetical protein